MGIKEKSKQSRNSIQYGIYRIINPLVHLLIKIGITPNAVTTIGFLGNVGAAVLIIIAGYGAGKYGIPDYTLVTIAGALIIGFSLFDMLDGQVARLGNMTTEFGAMYDSVLDRYSELVTLGSIVYYLIQTDHLLGAIISFVALIGSVMVSYVRARAEGLGIECKMGFMQRPERVVVTSLATLATGIAGEAGAPTFDADLILVIAMAVIAVFANMTAFARIFHCKKALSAKNR